MNLITLLVNATGALNVTKHISSLPQAFAYTLFVPYIAYLLLLLVFGLVAVRSKEIRLALMLTLLVSLVLYGISPLLYGTQAKALNTIGIIGTLTIIVFIADNIVKKGTQSRSPIGHN